MRSKSIKKEEEKRKKMKEKNVKETTMIINY